MTSTFPKLDSAGVNGAKIVGKEQLEKVTVSQDTTKNRKPVKDQALAAEKVPANGKAAVHDRRL